jgi:foldase protein PrsA
MTPSRTWSCGVVLAVVIASTGCGSGPVQDGIAAQVDHTTISDAMVDHWMSVIAGGRRVSSEANRQSLRQHALDFLISSEWLIDEADDRGLRISDADIARRLEEQRRTAFPGGEAEFKEFMHATGQRRADLVFEAEAELASAKIQQMLARKERQITRTQIARYYREENWRFVIPELREVEITNMKSAAAVDELRRELKLGKRFASIAQLSAFEQARAPDISSTEATLEKAIFSARPGVLTGPMRKRVDYFLFEVTRVRPTMQLTLDQARGKIRQQLAARQHQRTITEFSTAFKKKWRAKTNCSAGFVVQKCRQYMGRTVPASENSFSLG